MSSSAAVAGIVIIAWLIVALVLGIVGLSRRAKSNHASEIAYCQPLTGRLSMLMFAVFCVAAFPLMFAVSIFGNAPAMTSETWFLFDFVN